MAVEEVVAVASHLLAMMMPRSRSASRRKRNGKPARKH
jgi:hypothetical protein